MIRFAISALALLVATPAVAQDFYLKASGGQTSNGAQYTPLSDEGSYGVAVGLTHFDPIRLELGVSRVDFARGVRAPGFPYGEAIDLTNYSLSGFYDWHISSRATLFAGAGIDTFQGRYSFTGYDGDFDVSADGWHWSVGGSYALSHTFVADIEFRRVEAETDGTPDADLRDLTFDEVRLGLRARF